MCVMERYELGKLPDVQVEPQAKRWVGKWMDTTCKLAGRWVPRKGEHLSLILPDCLSDNLSVYNT